MDQQEEALCLPLSNATSREEAEPLVQALEEHLPLTSPTSIICIEQAVLQHIISGRLEVLRYLVSKCKVDVNKIFNSATYPLSAAVCGKQEDIAWYLIKEVGADINLKEGNLTLLHLAIISGMLNLVKYLVLEKHRELSLACKASYAAIWRAAESDHVEMVCS